MCDCEKHRDDNAECTCICPEHGNFQCAYDLAMSRWEEIRNLREALTEHRTAEERAWDVAAGHEGIARQATARAEKAEAQVEDLQRQLAEATGQKEAAKQATREIMAERNTWARQLADMRDERDTAREEAETQGRQRSVVETDYDNLRIEIEKVVVEWETSAARPIDNPMLNWQARHAAQLRRALARWLTT